MANVGVTLAFPDATICGRFATEIERADLRGQSFSLALPERKLNMDNEFLTILVTFIEHGGLEATAAFLHLARDHFGPTAGCVAIDDAKLVEIMRWLKPGALIAISQ